MALNKAMIIGNLGGDPELRYTQSGTPVANMSIATNRRWTDDQGQQQEETDWHRVVVFGRQAENCEQYLEKGSQVYVEGRIQYDEYTDRDGNERDSTEIVARNVQFLRGGDRGGPGMQKPPSGGGASRGQGGPASGGGGGGGNEGNFDQSFDDDDIPF